MNKHGKAKNELSPTQEIQVAKFACQDHVDLFLSDAAEITQSEFVPIGTTVNSHYYLGVM